MASKQEHGNGVEITVIRPGIREWARLLTCWIMWCCGLLWLGCWCQQWAAAGAMLCVVSLLGTLARGSQHSLLWPPPECELHGFVAPGYERVRELLAAQLRSGMHNGVQCAAFVDGECVVDLWGALPHDYRGRRVRYDGHTVQNIFSSSKACTSMAVAMLADRGYLRYNQRVNELWPEFAEAHNHDDHENIGSHCDGSRLRSHMTIAQVMRHEAGLVSLGSTLSYDDLSPSGVQQGAVGRVIAASQSRWPINASASAPSPRQYHGITRGWIVNEIFRRADPKGRTVGQFLRDEVAVPLHIDKGLVLPAQPSSRTNALDIAPMFVPSVPWAVLQSFVPRCLGRRVPFGPLWCLSHIFQELRKNVLERTALPFDSAFTAAARHREAASADEGELDVTSDDVAMWVAAARAPKAPSSLIDEWNHPLMRSVEIPSANTHANAHAMATVAAALATPHLRHVISKQGLSSALDGASVRWDHDLEARTKNVNAGWSVFDSDADDDRGGFVGWQGYGGSALQFHPDFGIGFGFAMNLAAIDLNNASCSASANNSSGLPGGGGYLHVELQREVLRATRKIKLRFAKAQ